MNGANGYLFVGIVLAGLVLTWYQARSYRGVAAEVLESNRGIVKQTTESDHATLNALTTIHGLVNSNLTAARQGELNASRLTLTTLQEFASFKEAQGIPVSRGTAEAIERARVRVNELEREQREP